MNSIIPSFNALTNSKITQINVVELLLNETGTYNQQFLRPYESSMDGRDTAKVVDRISEAVRVGASVNNNTFIGIGTAIVAPSASIVTPIGILNGWDRDRLRFKLTIDVTMNTGSRIRYIYTGFTSDANILPGIYHDQSKIDPNMLFKVNTVTRTRVVSEVTPYGNRDRFSALATCNVLVNPHWQGITSTNNMYTMRPSDVISYRANEPLRAVQARTNFIDTNMLVTSKPSYSNLASGNINDYSASIISNALKVGLVSDPSSKTNPYYHAKTMAADTMDNPLFERLSTLRQSAAMDGTFSFAELSMIDPMTDSVTTYTQLTQEDIRQVHRAGQTSDWHGSDFNTQAATIIANGIPAIMARMGLVRMGFTSTNSVIGSRPSTQISGAVSMNENVNMDVNAFARIRDELITRIEYDVLNAVTLGFEVEYFVSVYADLNLDMRITVGIDGKAPVDYVYPCFNSSALAPILTHDLNMANNLSAVFGSIIDECVQNIPNYGDDYSAFESKHV